MTQKSNGRTAPAPERSKNANTYTSRGKYGLDEGAPPARATTTDPLAECLTKGLDGKFQRAGMARRVRKRDAIADANIARVRAVIATLSQPLQDVANAWLAMVEAERNGEITMSWPALAAYLGIEVPAAKSRWHRAREQLGEKLPAWRELFPLDACCADCDQYATVLDQQSEQRLLNGPDKYSNDRIEDNDEWNSVRGMDSRPRWNSRGRFGEYSSGESFTTEAATADDEATYQGLSLKETGGRSKARPGIPRHINKDQRVGSMDRFMLQQRQNGYNEPRLKEAAERAKAKRGPVATRTPSPEELEFQAAVKAYDERRKAG